MPIVHIQRRQQIKIRLLPAKQSQNLSSIGGYLRAALNANDIKVSAVNTDYVIYYDCISNNSDGYTIIFNIMGYNNERVLTFDIQDICEAKQILDIVAAEVANTINPQKQNTFSPQLYINDAHSVYLSHIDGTAIKHLMYTNKIHNLRVARTGDLYYLDKTTLCMNRVRILENVRAFDLQKEYIGLIKLEGSLYSANLHNTNSGNLIKAFETNRVINKITVSPQGELMFIIADAASNKLYQYNKVLSQIWSFDSRVEVLDLKYSVSGNQFALILRDLRTGANTLIVCAQTETACTILYKIPIPKDVHNITWKENEIGAWLCGCTLYSVSFLNRTVTPMLAVQNPQTVCLAP